MESNEAVKLPFDTIIEVPWRQFLLPDVTYGVKEVAVQFGIVKVCSIKGFLLRTTITTLVPLEYAVI